MAASMTTDTATIAKRIASVCYGSSSTGAGSYYNPEARTDNCVFVSLAAVLGTTAPELSSQTGIPQPRNGSGGMLEGGIARLMDRLRRLGLVSTFIMSDVPFSHESGAYGNREVSLVLYHTPPLPDGRRYGHCVVGYDRGFIMDYQHLGGPELMNGLNVTHKVFPNGLQGTNSISCTIMVKPGAGLNPRSPLNWRGKQYPPAAWNKPS